MAPNEIIPLFTLTLKQLAEALSEQTTAAAGQGLAKGVTAVTAPSFHRQVFMVLNRSRFARRQTQQHHFVVFPMPLYRLDFSAGMADLAFHLDHRHRTGGGGRIYTGVPIFPEEDAPLALFLAHLRFDLPGSLYPHYLFHGGIGQRGQ